MSTANTAAATAADLLTTAADWDAKRAEAEAELALLEGRSGSDALDSPGSIDTIATRIGALHGRITVASRAAQEARRRAQDLRVADLLREAEALAPAVAKARKALAAHDAKTAELLAALQEHTGEAYQLAPYDAALSGSRPAPPRAVLAAAVADVESRQSQLRRDAESTATDAGFIPARQSEQLRFQADWARVVGEYRGWVADLAAVEQRITDTANAVGFDLETDDEPQWLANLRREAAVLRDKLALFPQDAEWFAGEMARVGASLDEAEVAELVREFAEQAKAA